MATLPHQERPRFTSRVLEHSHGIRTQITDLLLTTHTGTHIDVQRHFFEDGRTIDEYDMTRFVGHGVILNLGRAEAQAISYDDLRVAGEIQSGDVVLLHTGWGRKYRSAEYLHHPFLSVEAAEYLVAHEVRMVGIDTMSVDMPVLLRTPDFAFDVHRAFLSRDIPIVENLGGNLSKVHSRRAFVVASPLIVEGADGGPTTVVAHLQNEQPPLATLSDT